MGLAGTVSKGQCLFLFVGQTQADHLQYTSLAKWEAFTDNLATCCACTSFHPAPCMLLLLPSLLVPLLLLRMLTCVCQQAHQLPPYTAPLSKQQPVSQPVAPVQLWLTTSQ